MNPPKELVVHSCVGPTMGTRYKVSYVADQDVSDPQPAIDTLLAKVNQQMSTYDPQSELSRFNQYQPTDWFAVSPATAKVVAYCLELAEESNGAFDPTVGPLVNLWGFGPDPSAFEPPDDAKITAALERVGYAKVEARLEPPALRKSDPRVYLDLSAAAKGYGVDAVAELLASEGFTAYMVEIGGEVRTKGTKPGDQPWRIGVEAPDSNGEKLQRVIELMGRSIATSGDYRNFFIHKEHRYSHTINPQTGKPVDHQLATVSVLADTCLEADALATALLVMGPEQGYNWAIEQKVAAMFVSRTGDDTWAEQTTPAWETKAKLTKEVLHQFQWVESRLRLDRRGPAPTIFTVASTRHEGEGRSDGENGRGSIRAVFYPYFQQGTVAGRPHWRAGAEVASLVNVTLTHYNWRRTTKDRLAEEPMP